MNTKLVKAFFEHAKGKQPLLKYAVYKHSHPGTQKMLFNKEFLERELVQRGKSANQVAKELKLGQPVVAKNAKAAGIPITPRKSYPEKPAPELLKKLHLKEGKTAAQIAKETGININTIKAEMQKHGIENIVHQKHKPTKESLDAWIKQGGTSISYGQTHGLHPDSIRRIAKRFGLSFPKGGDRSVYSSIPKRPRSGKKSVIAIARASGLGLSTTEAVLRKADAAARGIKTKKRVI